MLVHLIETYLLIGLASGICCIIRTCFKYREKETREAFKEECKDYLKKEQPWNPVPYNDIAFMISITIGMTITLVESIANWPKFWYKVLSKNREIRA